MSCHPQVHPQAAFSLRPDQLQGLGCPYLPRTEGLPLRLLAKRWDTDLRSAWTVSHHESSPRQVPWEKHTVRTSTY